MGIEHLSKGQVSAMYKHLDHGVEELMKRPLGALHTPRLWINTLREV